MNSNTLLISYKTLTQSSELNENIDTKIILPLIKEIQEIEIETVIGTTLFEKLKADIVANNLDEKYSFLLDEYIKPVLINAILADLPFKMNYRFTNVSVGTRTSENMTAPEYKELQKLSDYYKAKVVWHSKKLSAFLCAKVEDYPEYKTVSEVGNVGKPATYDIGILL